MQHNIKVDAVSRYTEEIGAIWASVLGVSTVVPDDDFFALGGDSVKAVELLSEVNEKYGVDLSMDVMFDSPALARFVDIVCKSIVCA